MEKRRKGLYLRVICGVRKAQISGKRLTFITLTTNLACVEGLSEEDMMFQVSRDWHILYTVMKEKYGRFEFISVVTNEGNGVIHVLIAGLPFIWFGRLLRWWNTIHGMGFVWISKFRGSAQDISSYLMSQYLSKQECLFRFKMSNNWICKEFMKYWRIIKNCSRDYSKGVYIEKFARWIYPINRVLLLSNFKTWISFYIKKGLTLEFIPNINDTLFL